MQLKTKHISSINDKENKSEHARNIPLEPAPV